MYAGYTDSPEQIAARWELMKKRADEIIKQKEQEEASASSTNDNA